MKIGLIVTIVALIINQGEGLTCLQCNGILEPQMCNNIVDCHSDEVCSIEEALNDLGQPVYNLGCLPMSACKSVDGNHVGIIGKRDVTIDKRGHEKRICDTCCSVDLCNSNCITTLVSIESTDCADLLRNGESNGDGIYSIVTWKTKEQINVYCDMTTDGGGWTVFQNRFNGSVDFYRNFSQYENGFGNLNTEFWLGLKYIEEIANQGPTCLRVDLEAADGSKAFETFDNFSISPGPAFTLHLGPTIASEKISRWYSFGEYHNGYDFSTYDHDADTDKGNCAVEFHGAWWYRTCMVANLNGKYFTPGTYGAQAMKYNGFYNKGSLKTSKMMIRRKLVQ